MNSSQWFTGSGDSISYSEIIDIIESHLNQNGGIFIGTDSQLTGSRCVFASAICLHNKDIHSGGRYFFSKNILKNKDLKTLKIRIMREVNRSINIVIDLLEKFPDADIEVHIDIGKGEKSKTREFIDEFVGWTRAVGFSCKIKPESWASFAIADKHTK